MPKTKKKISDISLELSEKQLQYLQSDGATIEGLGVTAAEYNRWLKQPLFRVLNQLIEEDIVERDQFEDVLDEIKTAVLASQGFTYESIESHLDLYEGNLLEWTNSENDDGEFFKEAFELLKPEHPELQQPDERKSDHEDPLSADQHKAAQLILDGMSNFEIAIELGVSSNTVSLWRNHDEQFKKTLQAEHENVMSANQNRAIQLILDGKNNRQIADDIGVSRQTVSLWRNHNEHFRNKLQSEFEARTVAQSAKFASILDTAYDSIMTLLQSDDPQIKLKAAVEVLKRHRSSHP